MDKTLLTFMGSVALAAFMLFAGANWFLFSSNSATGRLALPAENPSLGVFTQTIYLSTNGSHYSPSVINAQLNQPLHLVGQNLQGCARAFVIPKLGIRKVFSEADSILEFTPTRKGSFSFSCSMGMYRGTINVI